MKASVIVEQLLAPVPGGTGRYTRDLVDALSRTRPAGAQLTGWVAARRDISAAETIGVPVRRIPLGRRSLIAAWARGLPPRVPGDVIHATTPLSPVAGSVPSVVTVHDAVPWTHPETLTARGVQWHRLMIERAARTAARIAVPTKAVRRQLSELVPGIDVERIVVLSPGVPDWIDRVGKSASTDDRIAEGLMLPERYVVTVATLEPRKGLTTLLDAVAALGPGAPTVVTVGPTGWGGVDPVSAAAERGLRPDSVRALGSLDDRALGVVIRRARLLVAPSLAEGFGLPVLEAMALGTPVLCSDDPAQLEVVSGAGASFARLNSAELASQLERLVDDASALSKMSAAGRVVATGYDWDRTAELTWDLWASIRREARRRGKSVR